MFDFFVEYFKHTILNLDQALHGIRYFYSHPDFDGVATRGSFKHFYSSLALRLKRIINDLFFATFPPHWHHTDEEIEHFHQAPVKIWFQAGYCAWRFSNSGDYKELTGIEDRRWDPRCRDQLS
ncbi:MAG: hypothetical protein K8S54_04125 [Spirochaetia bacterium]|nr:hypothetical protein [Spirochaetia bacterium]